MYDFKPFLQFISYVVIIIMVYSITRYFYYKKNVNTVITYSGFKILELGKNRKKIRISIAILTSIMLGVYSIYVTNYPYSMDRAHYVLRFTNYWDNPWTPGLNFIGDFLHLFTNNPYVLFFTITFMCTFITFIACRLMDKTGPLCILFVFLSEYFIYSFYLLKQAPAIALATLSLVAFMKKKWWLSVISLIGAFLFHESAFILIPLYLVLIRANRKWVRVIQYLAIIFSIVFFNELSRIVIEFIMKMLPNIYDELGSYINNEGSMSYGENNTLVIFKGFPYYWITLSAFWYRKKINTSISNYYQFLIICCFTSVTYILSFRMYWMFRFSIYGFLMMFIFAEKIYFALEKRIDKFLFIVPIIFSLAFLTFRFLAQMFFVYGGF